MESQSQPKLFGNRNADKNWLSVSINIVSTSAGNTHKVGLLSLVCSVCVSKLAFWLLH